MSAALDAPPAERNDILVAPDYRFAVRQLHPITKIPEENHCILHTVWNNHWNTHVVHMKSRSFLNDIDNGKQDRVYSVTSVYLAIERAHKAGAYSWDDFHTLDRLLGQLCSANTTVWDSELLIRHPDSDLRTSFDVFIACYGEELPNHNPGFWNRLTNRLHREWEEEMKKRSEEETVRDDVTVSTITMDDLEPIEFDTIEWDTLLKEIDDFNVNLDIDNVEDVIEI